MKNSPFLTLTSFIMVISTVMAVSSSNWLMVWLALEINLMSFIPIILNNNMHQETEASIKYFMVQAMGSSIFLTSSMLMWMLSQLFTHMSIILLLSLIIKIGMSPCHTWYPSVMMSISWTSALLLSTWQKLAPLAIMCYMMLSHKPVMMILASLNALTGGMLGMNQSQLRAIMAYSSITHLGWMAALIANELPNTMLIYFIMYIMLITPIFMILNMNNSYSLSQLNKSMSQNMNIPITLSILLMSLGGIPPMLGFFPKLMTIFMIKSEMFMLLMTLIAGSLCNLYFYLNIIFSMITLNQKQSQMYTTQKSNKFMSLLTLTSMLGLPLPMMLI